MPNLSLLINNSTRVKSAIVAKVVQAGIEPDRMPVYKTPADYGLEFKDVDIQASDGIRLSAWEITRSDTKKLAIVNHPLMCNRYGTSKGVDNVPVEFIPMLKNLYVAGYSILTYDQRGQGESDGNLGAKLKGPTECVGGSGAEEWKDLAGVLKYVKSNWANHDVVLVGQCMGANAIFKAFSVSPEIFEGGQVKCFAALQPTRSSKMRGRMTKRMLGVDVSEDASKLQEEKYGFPGVDCVTHAADVKLPILIAGMKADVYAGDESGNDIQDIFSAVNTEKRLHFFGPGTDHHFGSGLRFEGYSYYNYHSEPLIDFLNAYTGGASPPPAHPIKVPEFKDDGKGARKGLFGRTSLPCWIHAEVEKMNATAGKEVQAKFETSIDIDAPASTVWSMFNEGEAISSWCSSLESIEGDIKEGAEVTTKFKFMGLGHSVKHTVQKFQDGVQFFWSDEIDHGISNNHLFRIEAIDETHCRFINNDELTGGDPVVRYGALREMQAIYEQLNEELKVEAEKRHKGTGQCPQPIAMAAVPALTYFDGPGRAELSRLAFAAGGVEYTDTRIKQPDWPAVKGDKDSLPAQMFGSMPAIQNGDFKLAQSAACSQYAADLGINKKNNPSPDERALDTMVLGAHADIQACMYTVLFGSDESKAEEKKTFPTKVANHLAGCERAYARAGGPFLYGKTPTLGDLAMFDNFTSPFPGLVACGVDISPYPKLQACVAACKEDANVKAYCEKRGF